MNKAAAKRVMIAEGLPTPAFQLVSSVADPRAQAGGLAAALGLPLAIKPNSGGSSLGFSLAENEDAVLDGIAAALAVAGPHHTPLGEAAQTGVEVNDGVLGVNGPGALPPLGVSCPEGS